MDLCGKNRLSYNNAIVCMYVRVFSMGNRMPRRKVCGELFLNTKEPDIKGISSHDFTGYPYFFRFLMSGRQTRR